MVFEKALNTAKLQIFTSSKNFKGDMNMKHQEIYIHIQKHIYNPITHI